MFHLYYDLMHGIEFRNLISNYTSLLQQNQNTYFFSKRTDQSNQSISYSCWLNQSICISCFRSPSDFILLDHAGLNISKISARLSWVFLRSFFYISMVCFWQTWPKSSNTCGLQRKSRSCNSIHVSKSWPMLTSTICVDRSFRWRVNIESSFLCYWIDWYIGIDTCVSLIYRKWFGKGICLEHCSWSNRFYRLDGLTVY